VAAALVAALTVKACWPAIKGPFVYDDLYLPFSYPDAAARPFTAWAGVVRPLLMVSYWVNYHLSGLAPEPYHAVNLALHLINGCLVFTIVFRMLGLAGTENFRAGIALFAAGLFLLHPIQTEAVAYVAGRSEALSVMFAYAALALFLSGIGGRISGGRTLLIIACFSFGCLSKEHVVVLPLLFLLTDLYWDKAGIRDRAGLYAGLLLAAVSGALFTAVYVLPGAQTAGFQIKGLTWYQYAFTQCRAIWIYVRLFFLPFGQSADHDFRISRTLLDPGSLAGLSGLIAMVVIALLVRNRYRLASYGLLTFLLLLAPTSSFLPIADPLVERRLYLPSIGILLAGADLLRRWRYGGRALAGTLASVLMVSAVLSYRRNELWGSPVALWQDTVGKSPRKVRPRLQLADAYTHSGNCAGALAEYEAAARLGPRDYRMLVDWGLAADCAGRPEQAIGRLEEAAGLNPTAHVYSQIGLIYGRSGKRSEALQALHKAEAADPGFEPTYVYRGILYVQAGDLAGAAADLHRALELNPEDQTAANALQYVERSLGPSAAAEVGVLEADSVTPPAGIGMSQVFTAAYSHPGGASRITSARILFNPAVDGRMACYIYYDRVSGSLLLVNDAGDSSARTRPGAAGRLANSQCQLDGGRSSVAEDGKRLTVRVALTFRPSFTGAKNLYLYAQDAEGKSTGFQQRGTWIVR